MMISVKPFRRGHSARGGTNGEFVLIAHVQDRYRWRGDGEVRPNAHGHVPAVSGCEEDVIKCADSASR